MDTDTKNAARAAIANNIKGRTLYYLATYPPHVGRVQSPKALVRAFIADGRDQMGEITAILAQATDSNVVSRLYGNGIPVSCGNTDPTEHFHHFLCMTLGLTTDDVSNVRLY